MGEGELGRREWGKGEWLFAPFKYVWRAERKCLLVWLFFYFVTLGRAGCLREPLQSKFFKSMRELTGFWSNLSIVYIRRLARFCRF